MNLDSVTSEKLSNEVVTKAIGLNTDILLCPPHVYLERVNRIISTSLVKLGAQDCHASPNGAHTGDISPVMLRDVGCSFTIVGHSERRSDHFETNQIILRKVKSAWDAGIKTIICVGESAEERNSGKAIEVVQAQIIGSVPDVATPENTVVAYEPIWAIGSGKTPSTEDVAEMHSAIRDFLKQMLGEGHALGIRIIYGGSLKPNNSRPLMSLADVDGGLIGGSSLNAADFIAIAETCY